MANKTQRIEISTDRRTKNIFINIARAQGMDLAPWIRYVLLNEVKRIKNLNVNAASTAIVNAYTSEEKSNE